MGNNAVIFKILENAEEKKQTFGILYSKCKWSKDEKCMGHILRLFSLSCLEQNLSRGKEILTGVWFSHKRSPFFSNMLLCPFLCCATHLIFSQYCNILQETKLQFVGQRAQKLRCIICILAYFHWE